MGLGEATCHLLQSDSESPTGRWGFARVCVYRPREYTLHIAHGFGGGVCVRLRRLSARAPEWTTPVGVLHGRLEAATHELHCHHRGGVLAVRQRGVAPRCSRLSGSAEHAQISVARSVWDVKISPEAVPALDRQEARLGAPARGLSRL